MVSCAPPWNQASFIQNIFYSMLTKGVISSDQDKWDSLHIIGGLLLSWMDCI
jgi:hypothetical protein